MKPVRKREARFAGICGIFAVVLGLGNLICGSILLGYEVMNGDGMWSGLGVSPLCNDVANDTETKSGPTPKRYPFSSSNSYRFVSKNGIFCPLISYIEKYLSLKISD